VLLLAAGLASAAEVGLGGGPLVLTLNAQGQYTSLLLEDRPAPRVPGGGWSLWDHGVGNDETYQFVLDDLWPEDNEWQLRGPMWTLGHGWTRTVEPAAVVTESEPAAAGPARLELAQAGYSDGLRLLFPALSQAVFTIRLGLRQAGFTGRVRLGALPLTGLGDPTGEWTAFAPLEQLPADGEWYTATCVLAPPPTTSLIAVWVAAEQASGVLEVSGAEVTVHTGAQKLALAGTLTATDRGAHYLAEADGLRLSADYRVVGDDAVMVDATLTATAERPRALALHHALPVGADGWRWWDDLDRTAAIAEDSHRLYANWRHLAGGHLYSPYPIGCLTRAAPAQGLALASPLSQPLLTRFAFRQEEGLTIALDLGLAPALGQREVKFQFAICRVDATWGMRSAVAQHYRLFPADQGAGAEVHGARFAAASPEALPDPARFGLLFDEDAAAHLSWSRGHRLAPLAPLQPWGLHRDSVPLIRARQVPATDMPTGGAILDRDGRAVHWAWPDNGTFEPWSTSPSLVPEGPIARINPVLAGRLQGADNAPLKGVWLAEVGRETSGWQLDDFAPEHLRQSRVPLTCDRVSRRPSSYTALAHLDFLTNLSERLRARGQWLMADLPPDAPLPFVLPLLDVVGGGEAGTSDEHLMWLRAMAHRKPVTFLDPTLLDSSALLDSRRELWQQALQWAAFPGTVGWLSQRGLEAEAAAFDLFVPLLHKLSAAGWEPIPHAVVNDAAVRLERYGRSDQLHLVLRNRTEQQRLVTLTLDPLPLGLVTTSEEGFAERRLVFVNLLSRRQRGLEFAVALNRWQATFPLRAQQIMVLTPYRVDESLLSAAGLSAAAALVDGTDDPQLGLTPLFPSRRPGAAEPTAPAAP